MKWGEGQDQQGDLFLRIAFRGKISYLYEECIDWIALDSCVSCWEGGSPKCKRRARTLESKILISMSGCFNLLAVELGASDLTSLNVQFFICEMKENSVLS
jgi:hypothetical protein